MSTDSAMQYKIGSDNMNEYSLNTNTGALTIWSFTDPQEVLFQAEGGFTIESADKLNKAFRLAEHLATKRANDKLVEHIRNFRPGNWDNDVWLTTCKGGVE